MGGTTADSSLQYNEARHPLVNYIKFATGDYDGLTLVSKSDTQCDTGFTATNHGFHEIAWDGGGASAITLPKAHRDNLIVFKFTDAANGDANLVLTCATGETFVAQTLSFLTQNSGDGHQVPRVFGTGLTSTFGATNSTIAADDNTLTINATAGDNQTNIGAELSFYAESNGKWRIAFKGSEEGSGVINAGGFVGSTV